VRRIFTILGSVIAMLALTTTVALGAITFHEGPEFTFNGDGSVTVTADLSGLGNQPATATITQNATATYTCENPGGNLAPGQKGVAVSSTASEPISTEKNGRATIDLTAGALVPDETVSGKDAGCPNGRWTGIDPVLSGDTTATLTIIQGGKVIYSETITK
jgi:hypothetical protein